MMSVFMPVFTWYVSPDMEEDRRRLEKLGITYVPRVERPLIGMEVTVLLDSVEELLDFMNDLDLVLTKDRGLLGSGIIDEP